MTSDADPQNGGPSEDRLWDLYSNLLEEYRFQVSLNWQRTQYLLVLNVGLIGLATGLLGIEERRVRVLTAVLFAVGALISAFSVRALKLQHSYYRRTRSTKAKLEERLNVTDFAPRPTRGMQGQSRNLRKPAEWNVTDLTVGVMIILGVVNAIAFVWIIASHVEQPSPEVPSPVVTVQG